MNRFTPLAASFSLAVFLALGAAAQPAFVVGRPEVPDGTASSDPGQGVEWNGVLYFAASHPLTGDELWRWDGAAEPELVVDLCPGRESSEPSTLTVFDGRLYFVARRDCDVHSTLLYAYDGSAAVPVASVGDSRGSRIAQLAATGRHLYATGWLATPLWVLRGSSFVELSPGVSARALTPVGDRLFFVGNDELGQELWVTDGTEAGTSRVRDLAPGGASAIEGANRLFSRDGAVYFVARDAVGCGFWRSDGTEDGTWEVADLPDAPYCGPPDEVAALGDVFFFIARSEGTFHLWRSDGTAFGTRPLGPAGRTVWIGTSGSAPSALAQAGERVFFIPQLPLVGQLWLSDGTANGTRQVPGVGNPGGMTAFLDRVLFSAEDLMSLSPLPRVRVWASDGTAAGTVMLSHVRGTGTWIPFGDGLAFAGVDEGAAGTELWTTDGTPEGTRLAFDLVQPTPTLDPRQIQPIGDGQVAGTVFLGAGRLWSATAGGMVPVTAPGEEPTAPVVAGDEVYFASGGDVFRLDAATGSGDLLHASDCDSVSLATDGDAVYFVDFPDAEQDYVLYKVAGDGAERVAAVPKLGAIPYVEVPPCGRTFLASRLGAETVLSSTYQVLATDGTEAGTRLLFGKACGDFTCLLGDMAAVGDDLYLVASEDRRPQLWRTRDGVSPEVLADFADLGFPEEGLGFFLLATPLTVWGDAVVFAVDTAAAGEELWIADAAGARLFADVVPGAQGSRPRHLLAQGERLFFTAAGEAAGRELWVADGGGVRRLTDLRDGPLSAFPGEHESNTFLGWPRLLAAAGERILFAADDGVRGAELWTSDGTAEGTRLVQDLVPGPRGSSPRDFTVAGDDVFWNAGTADGGFELWTMPLAALEESEPEPPPQEPTCPADTACLQDGRFTVTVEFLNQHARPAVEGVGHPLPQSDETAVFWFFQESNAELIVKVLDGRRTNGYYWVFYGALSEVEYWITVTDTTTGAERVYHNPPGQICGEGDTRAFPAGPT